jgi:hypothetical protein
METSYLVKKDKAIYKYRIATNNVYDSKEKNN